MEHMSKNKIDSQKIKAAGKATSKTKASKAPIKAKDRKASEEKLLQAAEFIFSKHGYQGATTRMIAEKANLNLALINRYFDGKFGLLLKIIEIKAHECHALEYEAQPSLIEELDCYIEVSLNQFFEGLSLFKIVLVQYLTDAKFLKKFKDIAELFQNDQQLNARIKKLIEDKKVSPDFPHELIVKSIDDMIFGQVVGETLLYNTQMDVLLVKLKEYVRVVAAPYDLTKKS